jgi:acetyl esterase/lipase
MDIGMSSARGVLVEDICYRETASGPLLARLYRPAEAGPVPAVISAHGGRWVSQSRLTNEVIDQSLAEAGILVMALDFRMPPEVRYPEPVADINYAIRWLKNAAPKFNSASELVGSIGTSSGGHQTMLNALRPRDPRYSAIALPGTDNDAELAYVVACWPVLDPLTRYHLAKQKNMQRHIESHDAYWPNEASMAEGNPQMILARHEPVAMPPLLLIQGTNDNIVPVDMTLRFAETYRVRGGNVTLETYENQPHTFITNEPNIDASRRAIEVIKQFILAQAKRIRSGR